MTKKSTILDAGWTEIPAIEPANAISIIATPGTIIAEFETFKTNALEIAKSAKSMSLDNCDMKTLKSNRALLNNQAKLLDEHRKEAKRIYLEPFTQFEEKANELRDILKDGANSIGEKVKEAEEYARQDKRQRCEEFYNDLAPLLVPVVPFSKILKDEWLNKSYTKNPEHEIVEIVEKLTQDWNALKSMELEFYGEAELDFFRTLDLGAAISKNSMLVRERERIDTMNAEIEANKAAREPVPFEPEPEPVIELQTALQPADKPTQPKDTYALVVTCELSVAQALAKEIQTRGIDVKLGGKSWLR